MASEVGPSRDLTGPRGYGRRRLSELMSALGIIQLGDPILTAATRPFIFPDDLDEITRILDRLSTTADSVERVHAFATGAMGLAAPQINEARSIAILRAGGAPQLVLINPQVLEVAPDNEQDWEEASEGCLSFFDFRCWLRRPRSVRVAYRTMSGEPATATFDRGRLARDVLHEVDHLNGVLCIDHIAPGRPAVCVV